MPRTFSDLISSWIARFASSGLFVHPPYNAGMNASLATPAMAWLRDGATDLHALRAIISRHKVDVPQLGPGAKRLQPDFERQARDYCGVEYQGCPGRLEFVRSGQVLSSVVFLWRYVEDSPRPSDVDWLSVVLIDGQAITGSPGASSGWTSDQVILYHFFRGLTAFNCKLEQDEYGWKVLSPSSP
jgi:hypothetical protein